MTTIKDDPNEDGIPAELEPNVDYVDKGRKQRVPGEKPAITFDQQQPSATPKHPQEPRAFPFPNPPGPDSERPAIKQYDLPDIEGFAIGAVHTTADNRAFRVEEQTQGEHKGEKVWRPVK